MRAEFQTFVPPGFSQYRSRRVRSGDSAVGVVVGRRFVSCNLANDVPRQRPPEPGRSFFGTEQRSDTWMRVARVPRVTAFKFSRKWLIKVATKVLSNG